MTGGISWRVFTGLPARGAMLALVAVTGCSITFTRPLDPDRSRVVPPSCNRKSLAPTVDVAAGIVSAGLAVWLASRTFGDDCADGDSACESRGSVGGVFLAGGAAALAGTSAVIGFLRRRRCDAAHEQFIRRGEVCAPLIARWRSEADPARKNRLLREMPHDCAQRAGPGDK